MTLIFLFDLLRCTFLHDAFDALRVEFYWLLVVGLQPSSGFALLAIQVCLSINGSNSRGALRSQSIIPEYFALLSLLDTVHRH